MNKPGGHYTKWNKTSTGGKYCIISLPCEA
jgi:hypothetical protein